MATTAQRIKEALELRQMKQAELAEKTGIGKSSISTYIAGEYNPKQKNLYKIAKALNVSETWLMGLDVPMERNSIVISSTTLQNQAKENGFQSFINLISSAGYEITNVNNNVYEVLSERYYWHFKISKEELEELNKSIMNYVCYTTDKFMEEKYDMLLEKSTKQHNIISIAKELEANAAHTIPGASEEAKQHDEDIMDDEDF